MGGGLIFLKSLRYTSFNKNYRMSLISAGSISLDSTFKFIDGLQSDGGRKGRLLTQHLTQAKLLPAIPIWRNTDICGRTN
jgi:hypothetical protein